MKLWQLHKKCEMDIAPETLNMVWKEPGNVIVLLKYTNFYANRVVTLQTLHVDSTLKRRVNDRFHVVSTWNPRGVIVDNL